MSANEVSNDMYIQYQAKYSFSHGRAGTGRVNLWNGLFSFIHEDMVLEGLKKPFAISHVYRQESGWQCSWAQRIQSGNSSFNSLKATYIDGEGNRHLFTENEDHTITDEGGLGWTLTIKSMSTDEKYILTDENGDQLFFDSEGRLVKILFDFSEQIQFNYEDSLLRTVVCYTRAESHFAPKYTYTFAYSGTKLTSITAPDGYKLRYYYTGNGMLQSISYPASEDRDETRTTSFEYANGRLVRVRDQGGIIYAISYDEENRVFALERSGSMRVSEDSAVENSLSDLERVEFSYRETTAAVTDAFSHVRTVYRMDEQGRNIGSYLDLTETVPNEMGEQTLSETIRYEPIVRPSQSNSYGKYPSVSVSLDSVEVCQPSVLINGDFSDEISTHVLTMWQLDGIHSDAEVCAYHFSEGKHSYLLLPDLNAERSRISQTIAICSEDENGKITHNTFSGTLLIASAWVKAVNAVASKNEPQFRIVLEATYANGTVTEYAERFDASYTGWQYAAVPFVLEESGRPMSLTLHIEYNRNESGCYVANARLAAAYGRVLEREYVPANTHIRSGCDQSYNIVRIDRRLDGLYRYMEYYTYRNCLIEQRVKVPSQSLFYYRHDYNTEGQLTKRRDHRGVTTEYTYTDHGEIASIKVYHYDTPNDYLYEEREYEDYHFQISERDQRYADSQGDLKLLCSYEEDTHLPLTLTDVNGQVYSYGYDAKTEEPISLSAVSGGDTYQNSFGYHYGYLTSARHNDFSYTFGYDELGRERSVGIAGVPLSELTYGSDSVNQRRSVTNTYASGEWITVINDRYGNPVEKRYGANGDEEQTATCVYDKTGKLVELFDREIGVRSLYTYDRYGQRTKIEEKDGATGQTLRTTTLTYNSHGSLSSRRNSADAQSYVWLYDDDPEQTLLAVKLAVYYEDRIDRDSLGRVGSRYLKLLPDRGELMRKTYTYGSWGNDERTVTTGLVSSVTEEIRNQSNVTWSYSYDTAGNLSGIDRQGEQYVRYEYDSLNRLIREKNYAYNLGFFWVYDEGGNIVERREYKLNLNENIPTLQERYFYPSSGWRDQIHAPSSSTANCEYDALGNPTTYFGSTLEWSHVRRLTRFDNHTFAYDGAGMRIRKNNTTYLLDEGRIMKETRAEAGGTVTLTYMYGVDGVIGFLYNGAEYYYNKNLQGDVLEIYALDGTRMASYLYDAWGRVLQVNEYSALNLGALNPFRYRGYYYDTETGLYYLETRYYDPARGRFLNPDGIEYLESEVIGGLNLYAYCNNNPVMRHDANGTFWDYITDAVCIAWGICDLVNGDYKDWKSWVALGIDVGLAALPFVPSGGGRIIKIGNKIDNAVDVANSIKKIDNIQDATKVTMVGRSMQRVTHTAKLIGKADNLYDTWKGYDVTATGFKKFAHNAISMLHDAGWMFGKLRSGYTVIDVGITTAHKGFGLFYGAERFTIAVWKLRNIFKIPINYYW